MANTNSLFVDNIDEVTFNELSQGFQSYIKSMIHEGENIVFCTLGSLKPLFSPKIYHAYVISEYKLIIASRDSKDNHFEYKGVPTFIGFEKIRELVQSKSIVERTDNLDIDYGRSDDYWLRLTFAQNKALRDKFHLTLQSAMARSYSKIRKPTDHISIDIQQVNIPEQLKNLEDLHRYQIIDDDTYKRGKDKLLGMQ